MIEMSPEIKNISAALLKFQGLIEGVHKGSSNPAFKGSKYANLETVIDTARPALQAVGVVFTQSAGEIVDGNLSMTTMLIHADSGEWMRSTMFIPLGKKDPQGAGSAQTYSQRYSLMAILGLPPTDDDAETAIDRNGSRPEPNEPETAKRPANQLKKDGAWEGLITKLDKEMSRGPTLVEFDTEMKRWFWNEGKKLGFNDTWMEQLKEELLKRRADIEAAQTVDAIKEEFPGAHTVNETHPLEAG